jgi:hypothetical protein
VNCLPRHGDISKKPYAPGAVGAKSLQTPPDLTSDMYKTRTDGEHLTPLSTSVSV